MAWRRWLFCPWVPFFPLRIFINIKSWGDVSLRCTHSKSGTYSNPPLNRCLASRTRLLPSASTWWQCWLFWHRTWALGSCSRPLSCLGLSPIRPLKCQTSCGSWWTQWKCDKKVEKKNINEREKQEVYHPLYMVCGRSCVAARVQVDKVWWFRYVKKNMRRCERRGLLHRSLG